MCFAASFTVADRVHSVDLVGTLSDTELKQPTFAWRKLTVERWQRSGSHRVRSCCTRPYGSLPCRDWPHCTLTIVLPKRFQLLVGFFVSSHNNVWSRLLYCKPDIDIVALQSSLHDDDCTALSQVPLPCCALCFQSPTGGDKPWGPCHGPCLHYPIDGNESRSFIQRRLVSQQETSKAY
jgi:hypothetical protein